MKRIAVILCVCMIVSIFPASSGYAAPTAIPDKDSVISSMKTVNNYWIANKPVGNADWGNAVYQMGNIEAYLLTKEKPYLEYATKWAEENNWDLHSYDKNITHADRQLAGYTYLKLKELGVSGADLSKLDENMEYCLNDGQANYWSWVDAIFMSAPVFALYGSTDSKYFEELYNLYTNAKVTRKLYDSTEGLWFRDGGFLYPSKVTQNKNKVFWARGCGWAIGALATIISIVPKDTSHYDEYVRDYQTMAMALKDLQGEDGLWRASLLEPSQFPNPETSGSALFVYAMAKGINEGFLDKSYLDTVIKGWNGLQTVIREDGLLGYVQRGGNQPEATTADSTYPWGVGAFLLAGCELAKLSESVVTQNDGRESRLFVNGKTIELKGTFVEAEELRKALGTDAERIMGSVDGTIELTKNDEKIVKDGKALLLYKSYYAESKTFILTSVMEPLTHEKQELKDYIPSNVEWRALSDEIKIISVACTHIPEPQNKPENSIDGDLGTKYTGLPASFPTLVYDFGSVQPLGGIAIAFTSAAQRIYSFEAYTSNDQIEWTPYYYGKTSKAKEPYEGFSKDNVSARYLKIVGIGNDVSGWTAINEIKAYRTVNSDNKNEEEEPEPEMTPELYYNSFNEESISLTGNEKSAAHGAIVYGKSNADFTVETIESQERGKVVRLSEPTPAAGSSYIEYRLPTPAIDFVTIEADINQEEISSWGGIWAYDSSIGTTSQALLFGTVGTKEDAKFVNQPYDKKDNKAGQPNYEPMSKASPCKANEWYRVKLVMDVKDKRYNAYINEELVGENLKFRIEETKQITAFRIATGNGSGGSILVDNLVVSTVPSYIRACEKTDDIYVYPITEKETTVVNSGTYAINVFCGISKDTLPTINLVTALFDENDQLHHVSFNKQKENQRESFVLIDKIRFDSPMKVKIFILYNEKGKIKIG